MARLFGFILGAMFSLFAASGFSEAYNISTITSYLFAAFFLTVGMVVFYFCTSIMKQRIYIFSTAGVVFIFLGIYQVMINDIPIELIKSATEQMAGDSTTNANLIIASQTSSRLLGMHIGACGAIFLLTALMLHWFTKRDTQ